MNKGMRSVDNQCPEASDTTTKQKVGSSDEASRNGKCLGNNKSRAGLEQIPYRRGKMPGE